MGTYHLSALSIQGCWAKVTPSTVLNAGCRFRQLQSQTAADSEGYIWSVKDMLCAVWVPRILSIQGGWAILTSKVVLGAGCGLRMAMVTALLRVHVFHGCDQLTTPRLLGPSDLKNCCGCRLRIQMATSRAAAGQLRLQRPEHRRACCWRSSRRMHKSADRRRSW